MTDTTEALMTVQEVAAFLRVPVNWVYEWTRTRTIPVVKLGRHVHVVRADLLRWVESGGGPCAPRGRLQDQRGAA